MLLSSGISLWVVACLCKPKNDVWMHVCKNMETISNICCDLSKCKQCLWVNKRALDWHTHRLQYVQSAFWLALYCYLLKYNIWSYEKWRRVICENILRINATGEENFLENRFSDSHTEGTVVILFLSVISIFVDRFVCSSVYKNYTQCRP